LNSEKEREETKLKVVKEQFEREEKHTEEEEKKPKKKTPTRRKRSRGPTKKDLQIQLETTRGELERMEVHIASYKERVEELEDEKLRLYAEMDNARKRAQRRIEEERKRVVVDTITPILDVADNLERALQSAAENQSPDAILSGVQMVNKQLSDALSVIGIEIIDTDGAVFDYNIHEAVGKTPAPGKAQNEIVVEVSRGYLLEGRLLRPSRVIVASGESE